MLKVKNGLVKAAVMSVFLVSVLNSLVNTALGEISKAFPTADPSLVSMCSTMPSLFMFLLAYILTVLGTFQIPLKLAVYTTQYQIGNPVLISAAFSAFTIGSLITRYTVTASAGKGGSISPSGALVVKAGADMTFTIAAEDGYKIQNVMVDGASVGAVSNYTLTNIQADHVIQATFERTEVNIRTIIQDLLDSIFGGEFFS